MYSELKPITLIIKKFLALQDLNEPFKGGLGSYGLVILILAFLNTFMPQGQMNMNHQSYLGRVLFKFLSFYGKEFNPNIMKVNQV